ncbi:hypothetical protein LAUMK4_03467 [Mycobacterium persicum]|uniref:Uncharacterized protein n=1 Tax=Mycobacterium persicum TaxID=1487726 RepID=A0ABY6RLD5_9MYCO|nr:hypothetical protein LAUMK15_03781 [Mycobacterium persicum]VAZ96336.1 hypothetical protein LAUMK4_03467 [Mycobacterium persicum]
MFIGSLCWNGEVGLILWACGLITVAVQKPGPPKANGPQVTR